ncbi:MAG TPA: HAD family hydrolase [Candidatus Bathyarchaeia archaeon]|nr:HAD family hydrolase [Candidatus Bathyarchaeia archaeon]
MKAAIFDWDGTLAQIDKRELYCINKALQEHGFQPVDHDFYLKNYYMRAYELGTGPRMVIEAAMTERKETNVEPVYESYREAFQKTVEKAELLTGALELLRDLKQHGFSPAIATMRYTHWVVEAELKHLHVALLVKVLFTREDLGPSRALESLKETVDKRARLVTKALNRLKASPKEAFLVGDSWWDIRAGRQLGIPTVLVKTGFSQYNDFSQEKPDYMVSSLTDLQQVLEQNNWKLQATA